MCSKALWWRCSLWGGRLIKVAAAYCSCCKLQHFFQGRQLHSKDWWCQAETQHGPLRSATRTFTPCHSRRMEWDPRLLRCTGSPITVAEGLGRQGEDGQRRKLHFRPLLKQNYSKPGFWQQRGGFARPPGRLSVCPPTYLVLLDPPDVWISSFKWQGEFWETPTGPAGPALPRFQRAGDPPAVGCHGWRWGCVAAR